MNYTTLLDRFGNGLFQIIHALLFAEKRIVFIGRTCNATDVCEAVVALGLLGNSLYPQFLEMKAFPYTSVNNMSHFSSTPGFVVGTMNPIFEAQKSWWDVLCDVESGTIVMSDAVKSQIEDLACSAQDDDMCRALKKEARRMQMLLKTSTEVDDFVRLALVRYVQTVAALASVPDRQVPTGLRSIRDANSKRIHSFYLTGNFREFVKTVDSETCSMMLFAAQVTQTHGLEDFEIMQIFQSILRIIRTPEQTTRLLTFFPTALGGLGCCAMHLAHQAFAVRLIVVALLRRLESFPLGRMCISRLNSFLMLAYEQVNKDLPDTSSAY